MFQALAVEQKPLIDPNSLSEYFGDLSIQHNSMPTGLFAQDGGDGAAASNDSLSDDQEYSSTEVSEDDDDDDDDTDVEKRDWSSTRVSGKYFYRTCFLRAHTSGRTVVKESSRYPQPPPTKRRKISETFIDMSKKNKMIQKRKKLALHRKNMNLKYISKKKLWWKKSQMHIEGSPCTPPSFPPIFAVSTNK